MVVMISLLQYFAGIDSMFSNLINIVKARISATHFLLVIEHKNTMDSIRSTGIFPESSKGDVVYKNVDFKYTSHNIQVLKQLNFTIRENEMIGIVGESGSGKSTIMKLLM